MSDKQPLDSSFESILLHAQAEGLRRLITAAQSRLSQIEAEVGFVDTAFELDPFQIARVASPGSKRILSKSHRDSISNAQRKRWEQTKNKENGGSINDVVVVASVDKLLQEI